MAARKRNKALDIPVWVLLGLLILGLMGFGIGNYSGISNTIGKVGSEKVSVDDYVTALRSSANQLSQQLGNTLSIQDAIAFGASQNAIASVSSRAALDDELKNIGLSVGDEVVYNNIITTPSFAGIDGSFDKSVYELTLQSNGITKSNYDELVRKDAARNLLTDALTSGVSIPNIYLDKLIEYQFQRRSYEWVEITDNLLTNPDPQWQDEDLQAYYQDNPDDYTLPTTQAITYAWVLPDMLTDTIEVSDDELQVMYDDAGETYQAPEKRAIDRLVFPTIEEAQEAYDSIQNEIQDFDTLATEKGILPEDLDQGIVRIEDLSESAASLVFASDELSVVEPVEISIGHALYRINAIIPAVSIPFEEAKEELRTQGVNEKALELINSNIENYNDILASGATLEDLANETDMVLGTVDYNDLSTEQITAFQEFRTAASSLTENSFPEIINLSNGGAIALRLDATTPPTLQPFEDVKEQIISDWVDNNLLQQKIELAEQNRAAIEAGVKLASVGLGELNTAIESTRFSPPQNSIGELHQDIFKLQDAKSSVIVENGSRVGLALLTEILPADRESSNVSQLLPLYEEQLSQGVSTDYFNFFTSDLLASKRFSLNQEIINSVHSQLQ